jgi:pimeloyl-ACP methyl ester carboxylesterase
MLAWVERVSTAALRLSGAQSCHVLTQRGRVHAFELRGRGEGTFVLLHGMGTTSTSYLAVARGLLPHARRILLPDLLAHGRSEITPLDRGALALAMREALDTWIDPRESAIFLGTSLGGATALGYAIESPERVRALVLASPAGAPLSTEELEEIRRRFDLRTREDARRFFGELLHRPPRAFRLLETGLVEQLSSPTVQGFLGSLSSADFLDPAALATLPCPIRVVWGQSDRILPRSSLAFMRTTLPPGTHFEEPVALGHSPHLERPNLVVEHLVRAYRDTR